MEWLLLAPLLLLIVITNIFLQRFYEKEMERQKLLTDEERFEEWLDRQW